MFRTDLAYKLIQRHSAVSRCHVGERLLKIGDGFGEFTRIILGLPG